jgi:hypothetical protein
MTAMRDVIRMAALEVRMSALAAICEELRDKIVKIESERAVKQQGKAA